MPTLSLKIAQLVRPMLLVAAVGIAAAGLWTGASEVALAQEPELPDSDANPATTQDAPLELSSDPPTNEAARTDEHAGGGQHRLKRSDPSQFASKELKQKLLSYIKFEYAEPITYSDLLEAAEDFIDFEIIVSDGAALSNVSYPPLLPLARFVQPGMSSRIMGQDKPLFGDKREIDKKVWEKQGMRPVHEFLDRMLADKGIGQEFAWVAWGEQIWVAHRGTNDSVESFLSKGYLGFELYEKPLRQLVRTMRVRWDDVELILHPDVDLSQKITFDKFEGSGAELLLPSAW